MAIKMLELVICHLIGDYVLQCDFIVKSKGENLYHLFVHVVLYLVPFIICFGFTWQLYALFISHWIIDILKARYKKLSYLDDQILHYLVLALYFVK